MLAHSITREEINRLPQIRFEGEIVIIDSADAWTRHQPEILRADVLGFDTETRPSFRKGKKNNIALVQLATHEKAFLVRLAFTGWIDKLDQVFSDEEVLKIGVGLRDDLRELRNWSHFRPAGFIDLQEYVRAFGITDMSLVKIAAIVLRGRISKSQQLSNWETETLSEKQMRYAATDAWAALQIYNTLKKDHCG